MISAAPFCWFLLCLLPSKDAKKTPVRLLSHQPIELISNLFAGRQLLRFTSLAMRFAVGATSYRKEIVALPQLINSMQIASGAVLPPSTGPRVAIISSPRTGNTWLRHLLAAVYDGYELAVHRPDDVNWDYLPERCILQIHWQRSPALLTRLQHHDFRVVVLARQPLDVLLSILHFALHDDSTQQWLDGAFGNEKCICGAMPCSTGFIKYATGRRAAALLAVSRQWWDMPKVVRVQYERLVADPLAELTRVVTEVGVPPRQPLADAVAAYSFKELRASSGTPKVAEGQHHYWQGNPGHWKRLLPAEAALTIAAVHADLFSTFDYSCDPNPTLDRAQADANWIDLTGPELMNRLWSYMPMKLQLAQVIRQRQALQEQCAALEAAVEERAELLADAHNQIRSLTGAMARRAFALMKRVLRTDL